MRTASIGRWTIRSVIGGVAAIVLSAIPALAQGVTERTEFWPEADVYVRLNQKSRLLFTYSATREDHLRTFADGQVGGYIDLYFRRLVSFEERRHPDASRKRLLMVRTGYLFSQTPPGNAKPSTQHVPTIIADTRFPLPWAVQLVDRNRFDLQFVNGAFTPRYRNRLRFERAFNTGRFEVAPYVSAEAFYDWKYDAFNRIRYSVGAEWTLARFLVLEGYYTRQRDTKSSPEYVNALGLTLQLHLR